MASFELDRRSVAGCAVTPLGVVDHLDVVEDVGTRLTARGVDLPTHAFAFEQLEEALSHSVVMAVAAPTHAADQVVVAQEPLPFVSGELGGFNRSMQHLQPGGVCGTTRRMDEAVDRKGRNALSWCAVVSA